MKDKELTRLIHAFTLGDGGLRKWKGVRNAGYNMKQLAVHEDYVNFQKSIFESFVGTKVLFQEEKVTSDGVTHQAHFCLWTKSHPKLTTLYDRIYFDGRKSVSTHDLLLLDWQATAIWYMDDGYRIKSDNKYHKGNVFLCTDNYTHAEVILLQKALYENLHIPFNIRRRGYKKDGTITYRLVANKENADAFCEGVSKYIFPSFEYKLYSERLTPEKGDDIVCTSVEADEVSRNDLSLALPE